VKLTKRGRIVKRLVIAIFFIVVVGWLFDVTTPQECKVPVKQMSHFCKDLLYP
jgi:hypothetical protein